MREDHLEGQAQLGMRKFAHKERLWSPGQWVYCWRKFTGTGGHATRARWVGPGSCHSTTSAHRVGGYAGSCVEMFFDQLRPANEAETLGAELLDLGELDDLLKNVKSKRATAVDISAEGPPPFTAEDRHDPPQDQHHVDLQSPLQELPAIPEDQELQVQRNVEPDVSSPPGTESTLRQLGPGAEPQVHLLLTPWVRDMSLLRLKKSPYLNQLPQHRLQSSSSLLNLTPTREEDTARRHVSPIHSLRQEASGRD